MIKRVNQFVVGIVAVSVLGACAGRSTATTAAPTSGSVTVSVSAPASSAGSSTPGSPVMVSPAPASSAPVSPPPVSPAPVTSAPVSQAPVSPAPVTSVRTSPSPSSAAPSSPTAPVTVPTGTQLTLHGTVEEGVERGCLLLKDTTTGLRYNLTGGNQAVVKVGATLTVVGVIRKDLMSYCQQGQIFQVLKATAE